MRKTSRTGTETGTRLDLTACHVPPSSGSDPAGPRIAFDQQSLPRTEANTGPEPGRAVHHHPAQTGGDVVSAYQPASV
jgi:hypothetical protein